MLIIFINATTAKTSGALTVLRDCTAYIELNSLEGNDYYLFTVVNEFIEYKNVKVHKLKKQN